MQIDRPNADPEAQLIQRAQQGDSEAWVMLFESHFDATYLYCLRLTGGQQSIAEEVTQQAMVTAAFNMHRFKTASGTFRVWLLQGFQAFRGQPFL